MYHYPKVKGLNPVVEDGNGREKILKGFIHSTAVENLHHHPKVKGLTPVQWEHSGRTYVSSSQGKGFESSCRRRRWGGIKWQKSFYGIEWPAVVA
jgi:hypothetical protein